LSLMLLTEEFRTPVVDTLCCTLFNHGVLSPDDFYTVNDDENADMDSVVCDGNEKAVLLTKEGLNKVIPAFENKIDTLVYYPPLETQISFNMIVIEQVKHFKAVILEEEKIYKGYLYR